jgi:PHD/YefM family antitoxin component YafN of YafNO toxin-antitoxin module
MALLDTLQSVQFVTVKDKRFALIDADDWEALIEWLETLEDLEIAKEAFAELKDANGDRKKAGWLKWDDVKEELNTQAATV